MNTVDIRLGRVQNRSHYNMPAQLAGKCGPASQAGRGADRALDTATVVTEKVCRKHVRCLAAAALCDHHVERNLARIFGPLEVFTLRKLHADTLLTTVPEVVAVALTEVGGAALTVAAATEVATRPPAGPLATRTLRVLAEVPCFPCRHGSSRCRRRRCLHHGFDDRRACQLRGPRERREGRLGAGIRTCGGLARVRGDIRDRCAATPGQPWAGDSDLLVTKHTAERITVRLSLAPGWSKLVKGGRTRPPTALPMLECCAMSQTCRREEKRRLT
jgi:hypothetical protein